MSKATSKGPEPEQAQRAVPGEESQEDILAPKTLKVALVVEYPNGDLENFRAFSGLDRFLSPQNAQIYLVHALSDITGGIPAGIDMTAWLSQRLREREQQFEKRRETVRAHLENGGYSVRDEYTCDMRDASAQEIVESMKQNAFDLMVIYACNQPSRYLTHSHFSMSLTSHSPVPVLIWRKPLPEPRHTLKVMLGADATESSMVAAGKLTELIRLDDAQMMIATVQSPVYQDNAVLAPFVNTEALEQALDANANIVFDMIATVLEGKNIHNLSFRKLIGSPATELGYLAELEDPDLLVVGSHNRKGFLAWLMGSVSSQLVHWDHHNILVIR